MAAVGVYDGTIGRRQRQAALLLRSEVDTLVLLVNHGQHRIETHQHHHDHPHDHADLRDDLKAQAVGLEAHGLAMDVLHAQDSETHRELLEHHHDGVYAFPHEHPYALDGELAMLAEQFATHEHESQHRHAWRFRSEEMTHGKPLFIYLCTKCNDTEHRDVRT